MEESFGIAGTLQRETKGEVVLVSRLRAALERLNPSLPVEAVTSAEDELTRNRSAMSLEAANREVYLLLKEGIKVSVPDRERGGQKAERVRVVDWEEPSNNDFLLVSQFSVTGALYTCRPDLVGFVNGLPLVVIELKKPGVPARAAFDENLTHYKQQIPALFWYNALLIASNGTDSRVGSLTADWGRFFEWKRIEREDEPRRVSLEVMIRGTCDRARLLDLVENFTLFSEHKAGLVKIIGQNHQFLGVNNAIASMLVARQMGHGRGGVFWQTQGSGKSFSMVFFAQKVLRKIAGNWTFVVVTDRVELDDQIATTFKATGAVSEAEGDECHATSGAHLRELLRGNHRYVFTLIHKFQTPEMLCDRPNVIVMTDEAHRSQYETLALNMRAALPRALFLAFTGTPLIAGEERTKDVFGDYVSIYDFQQSVEDGATVPLFYENRTPELQLVNPDLNEDIYNLIEEAELDPEQEAKLERELSKQYHILTRDDRLETVAKDIVRHFLGRGFAGKAMVVSIDKATALKMHDKVRAHWVAETAGVRKELGRYELPPEREVELRERLRVLETTDMALIVSPGQNEIPRMHQLGLDIEPHRKRMNESQPPLDERIVTTLYSAVKPDPAALEFAGRVSCIVAIADAIRAKINPDPADITEVMGGITAILDESITGMTIREEGPPVLDLSKINFEALAKRFKQSKHKNTDLEVLKAAIRAQLDKLIRLNRTRADFAEKFEELIESYNAGSRNIEDLFAELVALSRSLSEEQQRHVRENMTEEELAIFDILIRPAPELSVEERNEVKKVARELLARLKQLLVLNWRQKSAARSQLKLAIEDTLDTGLPRAYTPEIYHQKCSALFEHVYESYAGQNESVYA